MNARWQQLRSGDDGSALVLALVVLLTLSLLAAGTLTLVDTSFRTTYTVRAVVAEQYAAEAAVDSRVATMRRDPTVGRAGLPCPDVTTAAVNALAVTVTCTPSTGSGALTAGGGSGPANRPAQALLTLGAAGSTERGVTQSSNNTVTIDGDVLARGSIVNTASSAVFRVDGAVRSKTSCSLSVISVAVPPVRDCAYTGAAADPGYALPGSLPAFSTVPACPAGAYVSLSPGLYDDARALTALTGGSCTGKVVHLLPGTYYLDFADPSSVWTISNNNSRVVGGTALGWSAGSVTAATLPFPGGCDLTRPGVTIVLGGTSRIALANGVAELCPPPNASSQRFSLYGVPSGSATTSSATLTGTSVTTSGTPSFTTPSGALTPADATVATLTATGNNQSSPLSVAGLSLPASVPAGSRLLSVALRARYTLVQSAQVSSLSAVVGSSGSPVRTATVADSTCTTTTGSVTALCRGADGSYDLSLDVSSAFPTDVWAVTGPMLAAPTLTFTAKVGRSGGTSPTFGKVSVDALQLVVTYQAPAFRALGGCLAAVPLTASGACALLSTAGSQTSLALKGSVYAPTAALDINLTNQSSQVFSRGVVARALYISVTSSSAYTGPTIGLPDDAGAAADRDVVLTAVVDGVVRLREQVHFDDATAPGATADVKQWSVRR